jgi:hypothetical protein
VLRLQISGLAWLGSAHGSRLGLADDVAQREFLVTDLQDLKIENKILPDRDFNKKTNRKKNYLKRWSTIQVINFQSFSSASSKRKQIDDVYADEQYRFNPLRI